MRTLEDAEAIERRTAAYAENGVALAEARALAEAEVTAERTAMNAEAERSYQQSLLQDEIDLARIRNNIALADTLSDQLEIQNRTREIVRDTARSEEEARDLAEEFVRLRREAINIEREHSLEMRDLETQLEAARLRGDTRTEVALRRRLEIEQRIAQLRSEGLTEAASVARAEGEVAALERADLQGRFREWFTGGVRAALEGDLDDFFENWIRDRAAAGLEDALNQVADVVFDSLSGVLSQVMQNGQSGIVDAVGAVFAGGASAGLDKLGADATKAGEALGAVC